MSNFQSIENYVDSNRELLGSSNECVGNTPLVRLNSVTKGLKATIAVKMEHLNPTASVKDRAGRSLIVTAEKEGKIQPGKTILVESTSGNMGISLAFMARLMGYKIIIVMPTVCSLERKVMCKAFGAEIVMADPALGAAGARQLAKAIADAVPGGHFLDQFNNPANPLAHYKSTGPEIWNQTKGEVDIVCFGIGSGGTVTGTGRFLKERKPSVKVYGCEPFESSVLNGFPKGPHKIQGIGAGIVPEVLDRSIIDEILRVKSDDAIEMAKRLALEEGIMGGITSGANVCAAIELAKRPENEGKLIVTTINSAGERYLSTVLYEDIKDEAEKIELLSMEEAVATIAKKYAATNN